MNKISLRLNSLFDNKNIDNIETKHIQEQKELCKRHEKQTEELRIKQKKQMEELIIRQKLEMEKILKAIGGKDRVKIVSNIRESIVSDYKNQIFDKLNNIPRLVSMNLIGLSEAECIFERLAGESSKMFIPVNSEEQLINIWKKVNKDGYLKNKSTVRKQF